MIAVLAVFIVSRGIWPPRSRQQPPPVRIAWGERWLHASSAEAPAVVAAMTAAGDAGDGDALIALGHAYLLGSPTLARDPARAQAAFLRASAGHDAHAATAAYYLGVIAQRGELGPPDPAAAARWFTTAVELGSPDAAFLLANAYRTGAGVPRDDARALALYRRAADREHPAALQTLALAYAQGDLGLTPDPAEAHRYQLEAEHAILEPPRAP